MDKKYLKIIILAIVLTATLWFFIGFVIGVSVMAATT